MSFVFITSFFKEMLNYSDKNKLTPEKVSELICESLIGEDKLSTSGGTKVLRDSLMRAKSRSPRRHEDEVETTNGKPVKRKQSDLD